MAFVRSKQSGNGTYYYLCESRRIKGKVKQQVIAYMAKNPTIEEAYQYWRSIANQKLTIHNWHRYYGEEADKKLFSEVQKVRAELNVEALEKYRDPKIRKAEKATREAKRKKQNATPSAQRRKREAESRRTNWSAEFQEMGIGGLKNI